MVDGIDETSVTQWLAERVSVVPPVTFAAIEGGRSNLTYRVQDASGHRWVLRRPPLHSVLASAHDVGREYRVMDALQGSVVPVPPVIGHEIDETITGAPFYVMDFVEGLVARDIDAITADLDNGARHAVGIELADTMAELHAVDVDAIGLGKFAKRTDYIPRQLRRWSVQYAKGAKRDLPVVTEIHDRLAADIPEQGRTSIVHGDFRLDNMIIGRDGTIRAVLDWELCTLGDPLADLGMLYVYWSPPRDMPMPGIPAASAIPGMPSIEEIIGRYGRRSTLDLSRLDYYVAFGYWKLAIILEGVYTRFASGAYGDTDNSHEAFGDIVLDLLDRAEQSLRS